jgi:hypothetical protein
MTKKTFKVGDFIKIIDAKGCEKFYKKGDIGRILVINPFDYYIKFLAHKERYPGEFSWYAAKKSISHLNMRYYTTSNVYLGWEYYNKQKAKSWILDKNIIKIGNKTITSIKDLY